MNGPSKKQSGKSKRKWKESQKAESKIIDKDRTDRKGRLQNVYGYDKRRAKDISPGNYV